MSVDAEELEFLQRRAAALGLYCNEHKNFDPCRGTGSLFVVPIRKFRNEHRPSLIKYATPAQCWEFFETYEQVKRETSQ